MRATIIFLILIATGMPAHLWAKSSFVRSANGVHGAVATVHPLASQAAIDVLKEGGNAIDAAVAAGLMLGVVDGFNSGIGGGCFILVRTKDGTITAIDGREKAPAAAHRDLYIRNGKAVPELSRVGPLAVGVPGALAAYDHLLRLHGSKPMARLIAPAAKVAREGFPVTADYAGRLRGAVSKLKQFPASAAIFLNAEGTPWQIGETLVQVDLADTYEAIGRNGIAHFYQGSFADKIDAWMQQHGGILTKADMAAYEAILRDPIRTHYRDHEIIGFPPPSSGGVHVAQMLQMLEEWSFAELEPIQQHHLLAEVMKLAFADRAHWLGDADFAKVPKGLINRQYAKALASKIDLNQTTKVPGHGTPPGADTEWFGKHTTHFCVADREGNWVSCTQTVNTTYGSGVVIPGTGVILNNEMDDFAAQPGVPNYFGLLGSEANSVAPGKRPLSSMSPTIVLKDGEPVLAIGAAGGPTIITQVLQGLVRAIDLQLPLQDVIAQPRIHHQWAPSTLAVEAGLPAAIREGLQAMGHALKERRALGVSQALQRREGRFEACVDNRLQAMGTLAY